jgi:putative transposase
MIFGFTNRRIAMGSTLTNLLYHVVFSTKNRAPMIEAGLMPRLVEYVGGIVRGEKGALLEMCGTEDHVHLLAKFHPSIAVSQMLQVIKSHSSKWINEMPQRPGRFEWQEGYGAFSVSESNVAAVRQYIQGQEEHHRKRSFQEEFRELLRRHGIEWDEGYVWG